MALGVRTWNQRYATEGNRNRRYSVYDEENGIEDVPYYNQFTRHNFIRNVYGILCAQLLVTFGIILLIKYIEEWCVWIHANRLFLTISLGAMLALFVMIVCCRTLRHKFPINLILLSCFTIAQGIMMGGMTCLTSSDSFLMAVGITAAVCLVLSLFAVQTQFDFSILRGILVVLVVILIIMGIVQFFVRDRILHLVYASLGALVFSGYLVIDTQLILGGRHSYELEPDEYILGALHLYMDIVLIFMFIYSIVGSN